jgi:hypothetical protein
MLMVATSPQGARPLLENIRGGRKLRLYGPRCGSKGEVFELLKTAGYMFTSFRTEVATVITAHLPELFDYSPALLDPDFAKLVVMPSVDDVEAVLAGREEEVSEAIRHVDKMLGVRMEPKEVGFAALVIRYLGQRCEYPIPPRLAFSAQLYRAAQADNVAILKEASAFDGGYGVRGNLLQAYVCSGVRLLPGAAVKATQKTLGKFLAHQTDLYESSRRNKPVRRLRSREVA